MSNFLRLTPSLTEKGDLYLVNGLIAFRLGLWVNNKEIASLHVNSGAPGLQSKADFRTFQDPKSRPGSSEPIPEGEYSLTDPEFATPNSYSGSWGAGLGPVWIGIHPKRAGQRSAFGFHLDANRDFAPGSAGCIVTLNLADLKTLVSWFNKYTIRDLVVDLGLGTVAKPLVPSPSVPPKVEPPQVEESFKIDINPNGATITVLKTILPGQFSVFSMEPSWRGKLVDKKK